MQVSIFSRKYSSSRSPRNRGRTTILFAGREENGGTSPIVLFIQRNQFLLRYEAKSSSDIFEAGNNL